MDNPVFLLFFLLALFGIHFYELTFDERSEKTKVMADKWTLVALGVAYLFTIAGGLFEFLVSGGTPEPFFAGAGFALIAARFAVKYWAVRTLGRFWSSNVEIKNAHILVKDGPYRFLRHPVYFARLMEIAAICLILGAAYTFLFSLSVHLLILWIRIHNEEKALLEKFGIDYLRYREKTGGLLPKL